MNTVGKEPYTVDAMWGQPISLTVKVSTKAWVNRAEVWILNLSETKRLMEEARSINEKIGEDSADIRTTFVRCESDNVNIW